MVTRGDTLTIVKGRRDVGWREGSRRTLSFRMVNAVRKRFGSKVDQAVGSVEMYVDGKRVHAWSRSGMSFFVSRPLKPWIEMWASNPANSGYVQWAGKWTAPSDALPVVMMVHGYGYSKTS